MHKCNVRARAGGPIHEVIIPMNPDEYGSRFGKCSCGVDKTKTIPCVHMVAVSKSSKIAGLTSVNIMPSWCYTAVWREQFGEGTVLKAGFDIHYLKNLYQPNPKLRYCPKVAAAEKTGQKRNLTRYKSPVEQNGKKKKKNKKEESDNDLTEADIMGVGEDNGKVGVI